MTIDLSGGIDPAREFVFASRPDDPEMRESVNAWIWDGTGRLGLPRIGVEALAAEWGERELQCNVAFPDGRAFRLDGGGHATHEPLGPDGRATHFGGGPLAFDLVEPFRRWHLTFDGLVHTSSTADQMAGLVPAGAPNVAVRIDLELESAAPPWENGALLPEARRVLEEQDEGALMGGPRYEQLARARGTVRVGDEEWALDGGALRIRRQGVRRLGTFRGHVWQSTVFPSGRAFGFIVYPPRDDGLPTYNEGYLFEPDRGMVPAWVVDAPWLRRLAPRGQDVSVTLATADGEHRITGETVASCFRVMGGVGPGTQGFPVLQQAMSRYVLDGETAHGMLERSMPGDLVEA